ncbi:MAG TPA: hypothetical protein VEL28_06230 [Candidatus Binatia bacterium]|nr:hypothetical protein [Candidatus Binatia bacterium]
MAEVEEKTPQQELKEKTWQAANNIVVAAALLGGGYFIGYWQFGDAPQLRDKVKQQQDRIVDLENERETVSTRLAKETRDKEVCDKELKSVRDASRGAAAAAPAAPAAPPPVAVE